MTVHELIQILLKHDPSAKIVATWEGTITDFDIYSGADGRVFIDADGNSYKLNWQETKCELCGEQAKGTPHKEKPVCYAHWSAFETTK